MQCGRTENLLNNAISDFWWRDLVSKYENGNEVADLGKKHPKKNSGRNKDEGWDVKKKNIYRCYKSIQYSWGEMYEEKK